MTHNLTITKYDSEFTSLHYLKLLQWFQESEFGKMEDILSIMYSLLQWVRFST